MDDERYRLRAHVIKALAHPTRLRIVDRLAKEETCVCELQALVGGDISTVSKHLSVLKNAGVVADRKEGLKVFYSLRVPCVLQFMACIDEVLESRFACGAAAGGQATCSQATCSRERPGERVGR